MAQIFLSYRRADSAGHAGRLNDHLTRAFGPGSVFQDVTNLEPASSFSAAIAASLKSCSMCCVVIGRGWLAELTKREPNEDLLVREIESALKRHIALPILVDGASMPDAKKLPQIIASLPTINALTLDDANFSASAEKLVTFISQKCQLPRVDQDKEVFADCRRCKRNTRHREYRGSEARWFSDQGVTALDLANGWGGIEWYEGIAVRRCLGCDSVHANGVSWNSESDRQDVNQGATERRLEWEP